MKYKFVLSNMWTQRRDIVHILTWIRMGNIFGFAIFNFAFLWEKILDLKQILPKEETNEQ